MESDECSVGLVKLSILHVDLAETFDKTKCILCQKKGKLTSGEIGRKRIITVSNEKGDEVILKRIKLAGSNSFVYHSDNKCYKAYVLSENKEKSPISISSPISTFENNDSNKDDTLLTPKSTRSKISVRAEPCSSQKDKRHIERNVKCIICDQVSQKKVRTKHRISEENMAIKFLECVNYFKDDVFERVADIENPSRLYAADIFYHASCLKLYLKQYDDRMKYDEHTISEGSNNKNNRKRSFLKILPYLKQQLELGNGLTLSEIRDTINKFGDVEFSNTHVKELLIEELADRVRFCDSERKNESSMVFSTHLSPEMLSKKIRSINMLKESAAMLRQELLQTDFKLKDQFKDKINIENSWKSTSMPENLLYFLSELFKIPQTELLSSYNDVECLADELSFDEDVFEDEVESVDHKYNYKNKKLQIFSLFQTMYYIMHNGRNPTPLHILTGHSIYHKCKGKQLITAMNRIGVSVSYSEVRRQRNQLAQFTKESAINNQTPLPSHFSKSDFTIGALDNADFKDSSSLSGTKSSHDTVMVLFQNCTVKTGKKPNLSEVNINTSYRKLSTSLPCQHLKECSRPSVKPNLPETFSVKADKDTTRIDTLSTEANVRYENIEFLISLIKSGLPPPNCHGAPTWAGVHALISNAEIPLNRVAFLPVIPHPVTQYVTVYTAMKNFQELLSNLEQPLLPFFCDEGVFHTVVEVVLNSPDEFKNLYPMMGMFHMAKAGLHCAGKIIAGSGVDSVLKQVNIFGEKTLESVLSGGHYVRALKGMLILSEAIRCMQWKGFWSSNTTEAYKDLLLHTVNLKDLLSCRNDISLIKARFNEVINNNMLENLSTNFNVFVEKMSSTSEQCKFLDIFLKAVDAIKNLVAADRNGDWGLHISAVTKLLPFFSACDSINYLRYGSYYLEKVKLLETEHPSLYLEFLAGNFVIKTNKGFFNAVSPDLKLEQTIQRAQKDPKGIVGQNRKDEYVAQWQIIYHEILEICSFFYDVTQVHSSCSDTYIHHELNSRAIDEMNESVLKFEEFLSKEGNPYMNSSHSENLHNFLTKEILPLPNKTFLLNLLDLGKSHYLEFCEERFVQRTKKLFDRITTLRFKGFLIPKEKEKSFKDNQKSILKDIAKVQLQIDIAKDRGEHIKDILMYDFPMDCKMSSVSNPNKSSILAELEKHLVDEDFNFNDTQSNFNTAIIVDFMSVVRSINFKRFNVFGEVLNAIWKNIKAVCQAKEIHFIYDSYLQYSIKDVERSHRKGRIDGSGVRLNEISFNIPIPSQMDTFWIESSNKVTLQDFSRQYFKEKYKESVEIILSGVLSGEDVLNAECIPAISILSDGQEVDIGLSLYVEEADMRIIPHMMSSIRKGNKRIIVLANDTDVVIMILRYVDKFIEEGACEIWIRIGHQEKQRFLPIHILYDKLGITLCRVLIKAYIASGCDWLTHLGSKHAALKANPVKYLQEFGEDSNPSGEILANVEEYLVNIHKPNAGLETFDELRFKKYCSKVSVAELPPSSFCIQNGHIRRLLYLVYTCVHLLDMPKQLDPNDFGWYQNDGQLIPINEWNELPEIMTYTCSCQRCHTRMCGCKQRSLSCTSFCKCENSERCENSN